MRTRNRIRPIAFWLTTFVIVFMWSGAVVSHLAVGDDLVSWGPPLMFLAFAVASRALRADRPETRPRAWAMSIGLIVVLSAVSLLTLPAVEDVTREWPVERGWVAANAFGAVRSGPFGRMCLPATVMRRTAVNT